jgi:hypothetical protein
LEKRVHLLIPSHISSSSTSRTEPPLRSPRATTVGRFPTSPPAARFFSLARGHAPCSPTTASSLRAPVGRPLRAPSPARPCEPMAPLRALASEPLLAPSSASLGCPAGARLRAPTAVSFYRPGCFRRIGCSQRRHPRLCPAPRIAVDRGLCTAPPRITSPPPGLGGLECQSVGCAEVEMSTLPGSFRRRPPCPARECALRLHPSSRGSSKLGGSPCATTVYGPLVRQPPCTIDS